MLAERISAMTRELDEIKGSLREEIGVGSAYTTGDITVTIESAKRWDAGLAKQVIPAHLLPSVTVPAIDRALAAKLLPEDLYAACQKDSTPRVVFG